MNAATIRRVWRNDGTQKIDDLSGFLFSGEIGAHTFIISGESDAGLSGTVTAKFIRADGQTVPLTGSIAYGEAVLTLSEACYLVPGAFRLSVFISSTDTSVCVYSAVGTVSRTDTDAVVDPDDVIPNLSALQTAAGLANAAASSADAAALAANAVAEWTREAKEGILLYPFTVSEWEIGNINSSTGNNTTSASTTHNKTIRTKNQVAYDGVSELQFTGALHGPNDGESEPNRIAYIYYYSASGYTNRIEIDDGYKYTLPEGTTGYRLTYGFKSASTQTAEAVGLSEMFAAFALRVYTPIGNTVADNWARLESTSRTQDSLYYTEILSDPALETGTINYKTGANTTASGKACRTGYIALSEYDDLLVRFDSTEYKWLACMYSNTATDYFKHSTGDFAVRDGDTLVGYQTGDKYVRFAFRRVDGGDIVTSGTGNDYDKILAALELRYRPAPLNMVDLAKIKSKLGTPSELYDPEEIVTVTRDGPNTITLETTHYYQHDELHTTDPNDFCTNTYADIVTGLTLERGETYLIRLRVDSMTMTGVSHMPKFRFYGTAHKSGGFTVGIDKIGAPGEYAALIRAHGYEKGLMFQLNGGKGGYTKCTLSDIMLAKVNFSMPYVPFGKSRDLALAGEGAASAQRNHGISNMLANSAQLSQFVWRTSNIMPCQWDTVYKSSDADRPTGWSVGDIKKSHYAANSQYMGMPYSSARMVDKMIGIHVSPWTFKTAAADPRSVIYDRVVIDGNGKTYYGIVCSTYVSHNIGEKRNLPTAYMREWDRLEDVALDDIRVGDLMLSDRHVETIMEIVRDKCGRILGVTFTDSGKFTAKINNPLPWEDFKTFVANMDGANTGLHPYTIKRYKDVSAVKYKREPITLGYPEETPEECVIPRIMSEYGDRAVLLAGEKCKIHILTDDENADITGTLDGTAITIPTIQTLAAITSYESAIPYFELTLSAGLYAITMTYTEDGESHTDTSYLYVCDGSVSKSGRTLTITGTNCVPVSVETFDNNSDGKPVNHPTEYVEGMGAVSGQTGTWAFDLPDEAPFNTDRFYKVHFCPSGDYADWGQATWYCDAALEEATPGDVHTSYLGSKWRDATPQDFTPPPQQQQQQPAGDGDDDDGSNEDNEQPGTETGGSD